MNIGKWGFLVLVAGPCTAYALPSGHGPAQQQTAQQSSDQTQGQKQSQAQTDALAEAARRAREQKKQEPKAAKVWDNDNIPTTPGSISILGEESGSLDKTAADSSVAKQENPSETDAAAAKGEKNPSSEAPAQDVEEQKAALTKQLEKAKEHLQSASTDLDILSRKYALDQQMYYGKPDYSSDTEGAAALKAEESQIASKKQEVADAQKQVDDLTAKLKELEEEPANHTSAPQ